MPDHLTTFTLTCRGECLSKSYFVCHCQPLLFTQLTATIFQDDEKYMLCQMYSICPFQSHRPSCFLPQNTHMDHMRGCPRLLPAEWCQLMRDSDKKLENGKENSRVFILLAFFFLGFFVYIAFYRIPCTPGQLTAVADSS